jgi:ribosomal protein S18 acetylase RimI-like enzyme
LNELSKTGAGRDGGQSRPIVEAIRPGDASDIVAMWRDYVAYMQSIGDPAAFGFDERHFVADGFGPDRAFDGLIARIDGAPAGYLLYHHSYDIDRAMRLLFIGNLWVCETMRRRGVGRALIEAAKRIARETRAEHLVWGVFSDNALAFAFYETLGAERTGHLVWMHMPADPA